MCVKPGRDQNTKMNLLGNATQSIIFIHRKNEWNVNKILTNVQQIFLIILMHASIWSEVM